MDLRELVAPVGRPVLADARSNDRTFQHMAMVVGEVADVAAALREAERAGGRRLSAPVELTELELGYRRAVLVRDPDGHCLRLLER